MRIAVGIILMVFGTTLALWGPRFAATVGGSAGKQFQRTNDIAFRLIGTVIAIVGLLYAVGMVGS